MLQMGNRSSAVAIISRVPTSSSSRLHPVNESSSMTLAHSFLAKEPEVYPRMYSGRPAKKRNCSSSRP